MDVFSFDLSRAPAVVGADEVGRGCVAGPLVGCAVRLITTENPDPRLKKLTDSKKLTPTSRHELERVILSVADFITITCVSHTSIDKHGLGWANQVVLQRSLDRASREGDFTLVDGLGHGIQCDEAVIKGDSKSAAIACASIIAKQTRDRLMHQAAKRWPQWGFDTHVGYPTKAHKQAIREHGPSPWQRRSFTLSGVA